MLDENDVVRTRVLDAGHGRHGHRLPASGSSPRHRDGRRHRPARPPARRAPRRTTPTPGSSATPPRLVTAVWVGYPTEQKPMTDVHGIKVTGGSFPAEIWAAFMKKALDEHPRLGVPRVASETNGSSWRCAASRTSCPPSTAPQRWTALFSTRRAAHGGVSPARRPGGRAGRGGHVAGRGRGSSGAGRLPGRSAVDDPSSSEPAGTVVRQDPEAGSQGAAGNRRRSHGVARSTGGGSASAPRSLGLRRRGGASGARATRAYWPRSLWRPTTPPPARCISQDPERRDDRLAGGDGDASYVSSGPDAEPPPDSTSTTDSSSF